MGNRTLLKILKTIQERRTDKENLVELVNIALEVVIEQLEKEIKRDEELEYYRRNLIAIRRKEIEEKEIEKCKTI